ALGGESRRKSALRRGVGRTSGVPHRDADIAHQAGRGGPELMNVAAVRSAAPAWAKRSGRTVSRTIGRYTAGQRMLPSFLIVGGQRCGTTSLHRALIAHPLVNGPVFHKGINYFDINYHRGPR